MYAFTEIATDREHRHRGLISAADHPMRQQSRGTDGSNPSPAESQERTGPHRRAHRLRTASLIRVTISLSIVAGVAKFSRANPE